MHHQPIDIERITAEAQKSAWLYDTIVQACPYPWGTESARIFTEAFNLAKQAQDDAGLRTMVAAPRHDKLAGTYTPPANTYYRNEGSGHVPSRGVGC